MVNTLQIHENAMGNLREVQFWFHEGQEHVPGLLYLPTEHPEPMPLVLIQHPGMGSKEDYFVAEVARAWAMRGWICAGLTAVTSPGRRRASSCVIAAVKVVFP